MRETRAISMWAVLLVVPIGLAGGWAVGKFSDPKPPAAGSVVEASLSPERAASRLGHSGAVAGKDGQGEFSAWTTMSHALVESERTGKPILIDFNAEWCPPCQAMSRMVFESGEYSEVIQRAVVPVSIVDRVREDGRNPAEIDQLMERFGVEAFPTLIVLNPRTGKSLQSRGFGGPEATVQWIAQAANQVK